KSIGHATGLLATASGQDIAGGHESVLKNVYVIFSEPGALPRTLVGVSVFFLVVGVLALARSSWPRLAALALTVAAAVLAAMDGRFPLSGRWALFLLPIAVLLLAQGAVTLVRATQAPIRIVPAAFVALLLLAPTWTSLQELVRLPNSEAG